MPVAEYSPPQKVVNPGIKKPGPLTGPGYRKHGSGVKARPVRL